ncbi:U2 snRNP component prp10 [Basidiobolus ranarum]|uniref:U2 snRNP component prp10 n=1 Tax=Basidiobolus ranarum TaxID=34480 RepID=A0ABR2WU36_9FUNG
MANIREHEVDPFEIRKVSKKIVYEDEYHTRRFNRILSSKRVDAFSKNHDINTEARNCAKARKQVELEKEEQRIKRKIIEKAKEAEKNGQKLETLQSTERSNWVVDAYIAETRSEWEKPDKCDATLCTKNLWDEASVSKAWDTTFQSKVTDTPSGKCRSRWDETPVSTNRFGATPVGSGGSITPTSNQLAQLMTSEVTNALRYEETDLRNRPLSDEELDAMFPSNGYKILDPPPSHVPIRTPARKLTATPSPMVGMSGFMIQEDDRNQTYDLLTEIPGICNLPFFKQEDMQHFGKFLNNVDESQMSVEELKERKILHLLLKIKTGTSPIRKAALRQITDRASEFGAGPLFNQILPLLMSPTLEDQQRHLLIKIIDRILYKLDDLVRPFVHKILVVIEPLLIDENYYTRVEGREIISNLSKAAGLATMIATMRPDIDHINEYVRNTTAHAFPVVASALGISSLLPFLKAVCKSKKYWQALHTGIKIVQQIAILLGGDGNFDSRIPVS